MALAKGILVFQAAGFGKKGPKLELRVATPQKKNKIENEKGSLTDVQRLLWSAVRLHALHIAHDQSQTRNLYGHFCFYTQELREAECSQPGSRAGALAMGRGT